MQKVGKMVKGKREGNASTSWHRKSPKKVDYAFRQAVIKVQAYLSKIRRRIMFFENVYQYRRSRSMKNCNTIS